MRIQLITFPGCPSAVAARTSLERALAAAGVVDPIEEVDSTAPGTAEHLRVWASPTILLDGADAGGRSAPTGPGCRLYNGSEAGGCSAPPESLVLAALLRAMNGA